MENVKNWIKKNWSLVVFAATVFIDMQFHVLEAFTDNPKAIGIVRFFGVVALAIVNLNKFKGDGTPQ